MIQTLELKNFKIFDSVKINFSYLNLLTGVNGVGKSTIIQALLLVRQSYQLGLLPKKGILLNGELTKLGRGKDILHFTANEKFIEIKIGFSDNLYSNMRFKFDQENDFLKIIKTQSRQNIRKKETLALLNDRTQYLSAERVSPRSLYPASLFDVREKRNLGKHGEFTSLYLALHSRSIVTCNYLLNPNEKSNTLIDQTSAWLSEISPGINIKSQYFPDIEASKISYEYFADELTTPEIIPTNVGFGITYSLPIIVAILSSKPGDILIIENPESHLHPSGQSKLGHLFYLAAISNIQLFIETHSDHIITGVRVAINKFQDNSNYIKLLFLDKSDTQSSQKARITYPTVDNEGMIDLWPENFFDQAIKDLNTLLGV